MWFLQSERNDSSVWVTGKLPRHLKTVHMSLNTLKHLFTMISAIKHDSLHQRLQNCSDKSQVPVVKTKVTPESDPVFIALGGDL